VVGIALPACLIAATAACDGGDINSHPGLAVGGFVLCCFCIPKTNKK
jgi:hypothetical protein